MNEFNLPESCPKCGYTGLFNPFNPSAQAGSVFLVWKGPTYRKEYRDHSGEEYLEFACERCGYAIKSPVKS